MSVIDNSDDIQKRYYSIREVAEMLNVNTSVLRFWEKEFPQLNPRKGQNGRRQYSERDIERLRIIHYLLKVRKFTLAGAREKLEMNPHDAEYAFHTRETLLKMRAFLQNLKKAL
ncbi:MAG: MerR family transcriptional regulator [Bacteroidota bacterium]